MFSSEVTSLLRTVLDEVCAGVAKHESSKKALVASKILESASKGERDADVLKSVGCQALSVACPNQNTRGDKLGHPSFRDSVAI